MKIFSYHGVLTASDFRGLAWEHLRCKILSSIGSCKKNHQNLIRKTKVLSHGSAEMTSEKREKTRRQKLHCIIDLLDLRGIISDVLDVSSI